MSKTIEHTSRVVPPPIRRWLERQPANAKLDELQTAWLAAEDRLKTTQDRADELAKLRAANDAQLAAATVETRSKIVLDRMALETESAAMPDLIKLAAADVAITELRFLSAVRAAADQDCRDLLATMQPLINQRTKLHSLWIRDQGVPRSMRMSDEERAHYAASDAALVTKLQPLEERHQLALKAYQCSRLIAGRRYDVPAKGIRVSLDTSSAKSWERVIETFIARAAA